MSGEPTAAGRIYAGYRTVLEQGEVRLPEFGALPNKAAPWFAVAAAVDRLREPPPTAEPWDLDLTEPVPERKASDGSVIMEQLPKSLRIRPMFAADLCAGDPFPEEFEQQENAQQAAVHGVELSMLEWRLSPVDVEAGRLAILAAGGEEAGGIMRRVFVAAGGRPREGDQVAWAHAAIEALSTDRGNHYLLECRTPGVGTVVIGPLRAGHHRIYEDTAARAGEWRGRLVALAKILDRPLDVVEQLRPEDAIRAWALVSRLKKKSEVEALSRFAAALSTPSTAGAQTTSTDSPSSS